MPLFNIIFLGENIKILNVRLNLLKLNPIIEIDKITTQCPGTIG
jgi:hypothetical protein